MRTAFLRHLAVMLTIICLLPSMCSAQVKPLPDLRGNAPEGTFLNAGEEPVITENKYWSEHVSITITHTRDDNSKSDVTIADIYVSSVEYLRRGFSLDQWRGRTRPMKTIVSQTNAILAMTGDYASLLSTGLVAANGEIYRNSKNNSLDNCLVLKNGQMITYKRLEMAVEEVLDDGLWHSFLFGPALLDNGAAIDKFNSKIRPSNPRSVLGYFSPGHYCFIVVDGRSSKSHGMTMNQLSLYMQSLGCQTAYNLDGGQSAIMWFNGEIVSSPYKGGRPLTDIVYVSQE